MSCREYAVKNISGLLVPPSFLRALPVPVTAIDKVNGVASPPTCHPGRDMFDFQIVATRKLSGISRIYTSTLTTLSPLQKSSL
jgi:hypothetical protein